ncbi:HK97 family phage prohead protease, partial [Pseudoalteromonas sp. T1lg21]
RNPLGEQLLIDMQDSIRTNISVGYRILEATLTKREGDNEHYRITKWQPMEISSVSVPADPTVGVGRSDENSNNVNIREAIKMDENEILDDITPAEDETRQTPAPNQQTQQRSQQQAPFSAPVNDAQRIAQTGSQYGAETLANECIRDGKSFEEFNS